MNRPLPVFNHAYILGISFISALGGYLFGFDFAVISGAFSPALLRLGALWAALRPGTWPTVWGGSRV